jgi:UDP-N-acetylglucosamine--N-acetylmuramyl-(pentapeptide) pyrophosphoryl-undecaprenol N-acetylglucosamine transferase
MNKKKIFIVAGGTGGHIFPGLAVANALKDRYDIIWIASKHGIENFIVGKNFIYLVNIDILPFRKKGVNLIKFPFYFLKSLVQSLYILYKYKPFCVMSFGGYVSFPISIVAKILGKKLVIHEQNKIAGLTNKILNYFANKTLTAYNNVLNLKNTIVVGNPIRDDLLNVKSIHERYDLLKQKIRILVVGGSLGARVFNQILPEILGNLNNVSSIIHQYGSDDITDIDLMYQDSKIPVEKIKFIDNMADVYSKVDLVICRAGALTVSEVASIGVAAIFVPYPYAVDDHQRHNISDIIANGSAIMVLQDNFTKENLKEIIGSLTLEECFIMANKIKNFAINDSIVKIVDIVDNL